MAIMREMAMKLGEWAGRPQVHIVGLFVSLMVLIAVVAYSIGTLEYTKPRGKLMLTAILVAGYFLTMLVATRVPGDGTTPRLREAAQVVATAALFLLMLGLWGTPDSDAYWKAAAIATLLAMGLVLTGMAFRLERSGKAKTTLSLGCAGSSLVLTVLASFAIALEIKAEPYWWAFGVFFLCWLAFAIPLVAVRFRRGGNTPE